MTTDVCTRVRDDLAGDGPCTECGHERDAHYSWVADRPDDYRCVVCRLNADRAAGRPHPMTREHAERILRSFEHVVVEAGSGACLWMGGCACCNGTWAVVGKPPDDEDWRGRVWSGLGNVTVVGSGASGEWTIYGRDVATIEVTWAEPESAA